MSRPRLPLRRTLALYLGALLVMAGAAVGIACGTTSAANTLLPITGITVSAETLTEGRGCGTGPSQVFKYAVVVFGLDIADATKPMTDQRFDEMLGANVYDCFTDAQFVNLGEPAGNINYKLQVFAYNQTAYEAAGGDPILKGIATRLQFYRNVLDNDGGSEVRSSIALDLTRLNQTKPTLTSTCTAQQIDSVQSLAICQPFALGLTGVGATPDASTPAAAAVVTLSAASFPKEGGTVTCDTDYTTVRYRTSTGGTFSSITNAPCDGLTITIPNATAPASYTIEIALLAADAGLLGQTTCGADTSPGVTTTAVCAPLH